LLGLIGALQIGFVFVLYCTGRIVYIFGTAVCADIKKTYDSFANAVQFFVCMILSLFFFCDGLDTTVGEVKFG